MRKKIALLYAMQEEARPLIEHLKLIPEPNWGDSRLPFLHYQGSFGHSLDLLLSINGKDPKWGVDQVGTEPAALNAYITLSRFQPDLCINAGTAGGFKSQGARIGDVYLSSDAFRFHDRRIPIPGSWENYGTGHYPVHLITGLKEAIDLKTGVVTTGNSLDFNPTDWERMQQNQGAIKEMEAAGIAWVASLLKIPMIALKSVTDWVDHHESAQDQFVKNLQKASETLKTKVLATLEYLKSESHWNLPKR